MKELKLRIVNLVVTFKTHWNDEKGGKRFKKIVLGVGCFVLLGSISIVVERSNKEKAQIKLNTNFYEALEKQDFIRLKELLNNISGNDEVEVMLGNYGDKYKLSLEKGKMKHSKYQDFVDITSGYIDIKEHKEFASSINNKLAEIEESRETTWREVKNLESDVKREKASLGKMKMIIDREKQEAVDKEEEERGKIEEERVEKEKSQKAEEEKINELMGTVGRTMLWFYKGQIDSDDLDAHPNVLLDYKGREKINGTEYYLFMIEVNGVMSGDSVHAVRASDSKHFVHFSSGEMMPIEKYLETSKPVCQVTIGELSKSPTKYRGEKIEVSGRICYIKEELGIGELAIQNNYGEAIHVKYSGETSFSKGDYINVIGTGNGTSKELSYTNEIFARELPLIRSDINSMFRR